MRGDPGEHDEELPLDRFTDCEIFLLPFRQELLAWLNNLLQLNITKIEQCGTGYGFEKAFLLPSPQLKAYALALEMMELVEI